MDGSRFFRIAVQSGADGFGSAGRQSDFGSAVGGDGDHVGGPAILPLPLAFNPAVHAVVGGAGAGEAPAGPGRDDKAVLSLHPDGSASPPDSWDRPSAGPHGSSYGLGTRW